MKKTSASKNSKKQNLSEDSDSDYVERVKAFEDTRSFVSNDDKLKNYSQNSLLRRSNECDSDSDYSEKAQYNKRKETVCGYCRQAKHSVNDCPLFMNAIKQQSNMLHTYNASSSNDFKQVAHLTLDNEIDRQHLQLLEKAKHEYTSKHCNNHAEASSEGNQEFLKLMQKAQEEYYSKYCKYCKEYGHLVEKCEILEKVSQRESEDNSKLTEKKKSKKSKKNKALPTKVHDLSEIDYSISDCTTEVKQNNFLNYCHYCKGNGHIENVCPSVQKALKKSKGKQTIVLPKIHKKDVVNALAKVMDFKKSKMCSFCGNSDHKDDDCTEKNHYLKKHGNSSNEKVQLKDMCPSLEEDVRQLENHKFYLNGQVANKDLNKKTKLKHVQTSNKCNFCHESDHSESECEEKLQYEYISKYCHYCDVYGHFEDTCPLVDAAREMGDQSWQYCHYCEEWGHFEGTCQLAQAAKEMENQNYPQVVSPKNSKRVSFAKDVTTLTKNLVDLKICHICEEIGHEENDCFVKQQAEFYKKYCDLCEENGHYDKECPMINKESSNSNAISNNGLKKKLQVEAALEYASICSDHYVCENCHNVYSNNQNSNESKTKNEGKTTLQSSSEASANSLRYCTLCGIQGLINTCILKEKLAAK